MQQPFETVSGAGGGRRRGPPAARLALASLALVLWAGIQGCKTVEIDAPPKDSTSTMDSATLRVTNRIEQDAGSITLLLYPGNTLDFINRNLAKQLGDVAFESTAVFKVPAGTWKLAYEDGTGTVNPMTDTDAAAQDWLKALFGKDGDYSLILTSDIDRTRWDPTFATDPPIE